MSEKKLYRLKDQKILGGVAGGLAEYFSVDPTLVRVLFIVAFIAGGAGLFAYILLWAILPSKPLFNAEGIQVIYEDSNMKKNKKDGVTGGLVLITIGCIFLAGEFFPWVHFGKLWPVILVVIGISLLWNNSNRRNDQIPDDKSSSSSALDEKE